MRVYLAGAYKFAEFLEGWAKEFRRFDFEVVSTWHRDAVPGVEDGDLDAEAKAAAAWCCLEEVSRAEAIVSYCPMVADGRGGRHVEFGAGLALGVRQLVVGWPETIFHFHARVTVCENVHEAVAVLLAERLASRRPVAKVG